MTVLGSPRSTSVCSEHDLFPETSLSHSDLLSFRAASVFPWPEQEPLCPVHSAQASSSLFGPPHGYDLQHHVGRGGKPAQPLACRVVGTEALALPSFSCTALDSFSFLLKLCLHLLVVDLGWPLPSSAPMMSPPLLSNCPFSVLCAVCGQLRDFSLVWTVQ